MINYIFFILPIIFLIALNILNLIRHKYLLKTYKTVKKDQDSIDKRLKQINKFCFWKLNIDNFDNKFFETDCQNSFIFSSGDIKDNNFKFCPFCRGKIYRLSVAELEQDNKNDL